MFYSFNFNKNKECLRRCIWKDFEYDLEKFIKTIKTLQVLIKSIYYGELREYDRYCTINCEHQEKRGPYSFSQQRTSHVAMAIHLHIEGFYNHETSFPPRSFSVQTFKESS